MESVVRDGKVTPLQRGGRTRAPKAAIPRCKENNNIRGYNLL